MHCKHYSHAVILLLLTILTACEPNDNPVPEPQNSNTLVKWQDYYYREQPDGQWLREDGFVYGFKYNANGSLNIIDIGIPERVYYGDTMVYDQGKLIGVNHAYLKYKLVFGDGRLSSISLVIPGQPSTPYGIARQSEHMYYRVDGKIDSTVGKNALHSGDTITRTRYEYSWQGEDLHQIVAFYRDPNGILIENHTDTFTYEDRLLPFDLKAQAEGIKVFLITSLWSAWEYQHLYSKRLIKSRVRTFAGSNTREVTTWMHRFDEKKRWAESLYATIKYENNVKTEEKRYSISYSYK